MNAMTLEPCPFCGAKDAEVYPFDRSNMDWNVCCGNPGCVTRGDNNYLTKSDAVAAWNRRAHIAQPAQAVDVGAVRRVIDELNGYCEASDDSCYGTLATNLVRSYTEQLARSISGEKAGPVGGLSSETFGDWCNALTHAYMYVTERSWGNAHYGIEAVLNDLREWQRKLTPPSTSPAPDKECQS